MKTYIKTIVIFLLLSFILPTCSSKKSEGINPIILFLLLQNLGIRVGSGTGAGSSTGTGTGTGTGSTGSVTVTGKVTYEFPTYSASNGLNLSSPTLTSKNAKQIQVQILDNTSAVIGTGNTDDTGTYTVTLTTNATQIRVRANARVMANTLNTNYASSDTTNNILVNILDNTNSSANWSIVSDAVTVTSSITQNLSATHASRAAGAFAILGVAVDAYNLFKTAEPGVTFTKLDINWSINNVDSATTTGCPKTSGCIGTSHWDNTALYILGKANSDTDEYDSPVIGHEFGHYAETTLFRSDSIGGSHGGSDMLDPRLAFGEGFGTAFGSMVLNDPVYYDTLGTNNTTVGVLNNLESGTTTNPGVYSETSVMKILWDIYDSTSDGETVSLGFTPIYTVLRNDQKNTSAFTTLLPFIHGLKTRNSSIASAIDTLTALESVASITGDFTIATEPSTTTSTPANCRTSIYNTNSVASYSDTAVPIQPNFGGNGSNKYCATKYYRMSTTGFKTFTLTPSTSCDLGIFLYDKGVLKGSSDRFFESTTAETFTYTLVGTEVLEVRFYSKSGSSSTGACTYNLTIN